MNNIPNLAQNIAEPFDNTKDYEARDFVEYNGLLYTFTTNHSAGEWNLDEVSKVTLADVMKGTANSNLGGNCAGVIISSGGIPFFNDKYFQVVDGNLKCIKNCTVDYTFSLTGGITNRYYGGGQLLKNDSVIVNLWCVNDVGTKLTYVYSGELNLVIGDIISITSNAENGYPSLSSLCLVLK